MVKERINRAISAGASAPKHRITSARLDSKSWPGLADVSDATNHPPKKRRRRGSIFGGAILTKTTEETCTAQSGPTEPMCHPNSVSKAVQRFADLTAWMRIRCSSVLINFAEKTEVICDATTQEIIASGDA